MPARPPVPPSLTLHRRLALPPRIPILLLRFPEVPAREPSQQHVLVRPFELVEGRQQILLIAGAEDNTAPTVMIRSTLNLYRKKSTAVTEFKEFAGRGHSLTIDSGWRELAEYCLAWLQGKQL